MKPLLTLLAGASPLLSSLVRAQVVSYESTPGLTFVEGTRTEVVTRQTGPPTGPYNTYTTRITFSRDDETDVLTTTVTGIVGSSSVTLTLSPSSTVFGGNATSSATSTAAQPTNTQPCNNYVEFCSRKYSNISFVGAHNSPFVRPGNSGSNQALDVRQQLDDGVRFIQAQIQFPSDDSTVPHFCHTTCDLLDAGPITDWLGQVVSWVDAHPYDVVTILLGNGAYSDPSVLVPYINQTGILRYVYEPPFLPMALDDWPTLEEMIVRGKRVVMFLDYVADQIRYPWLLDEFAQVWETPFDPLDRDFPCTVQRPPDLSPEAARDRLYLMNHNLNVEFNVFDTQLLVPAVSLLNETNNYTGFGSLGLAANNCRSDWGRAPNFLNVDYYNYGGFPGSVFEAAARVNNVTYNRECCGVARSAAVIERAVSWTLLLAFPTLAVYLDLV
ncbi:hypothetical protein S40288_06083 [Stachybotrys chartarum IBT 40288]|nr:hypothetical protein S40288_06083 [Stachybotrys chartarum IBT 40288]